MNAAAGHGPRPSFARYLLGTILRPGPTFAGLLQDDRRLGLGSRALALNALLYTLVYVFLTIGKGAPSVFTPFLAISRESYYYYNRFMLAPSMFLGWIAAAGVAQLLSRPLGGKGRFEDNLSVFGFATLVPCLASLLHDLPDSLLGALGLLDLRAYEVTLNSPTVWRGILLALYGVSILWFLVLYPLGLAAAQRLRPAAAVLAGVPAYLVYQAIFAIFNR